MNLPKPYPPGDVRLAIFPGFVTYPVVIHDGVTTHIHYYGDEGWTEIKDGAAYPDDYESPSAWKLIPS